MRMRNRKISSPLFRGFTLIEVISATAITALLLGSLYTVFHGTIRLRDKTFETVEAGLPRSYVTTLVRRDLKSLAAPVGILSGAVIGETEESEGFRTDRIEFYTTSGTVSEEYPWGDVQKIEYYLTEPPEEREDEEGQDLVRAVSRNLLESVVSEPEEQRLLSGVQSLEIGYFDGETWTDTWDSTVMENKSPRAIKIRLDFALQNTNEQEKPPLELICEIAVQQE